jgi:peptidoglycan-N-acetylglucosamine deacetylase
LPEPAIILAVATATAAVATGGTLAYAALSPGSQLFGRTLITVPNPNQVALTYDDGPNDAATEALLDVLAAHNARAPFFMIGKFVRQRPDIVRRVHAAGHLIGNHTETHPWLNRCSPDRVRDEMSRCQHALEDTLGVPVRYFRPPHGARRPAVFTVARDLELKVVQWNAMGWDWEPLGPDRILANVDRGLTRARKHGVAANILLHDGWDQSMGADRSATVAVTDTLLKRWTHQGIQPVTVDAWL